tara:strand:- start:120597 stop:121013 length:417 start_codon:yes stop_codon:yes gene_type:complete
MNKSTWITAGAITCMVTAISWAQSDNSTINLDDEIPKAALLTERGQQLAERLKMLRHNEASMGPKHPAMEETRLQIEEVKLQLEAWSPAPNPFRGGGEVPMRAIPQMNDEDLRQLVIRLTDDMRLLEQRLERVERRTR